MQVASKQLIHQHLLLLLLLRLITQKKNPSGNRAASPFPEILDVCSLDPEEIIKIERDPRISRPVTPIRSISPYPKIPDVTLNPELATIVDKPRISPPREKRSPSPFPVIPDVTDLKPDEVMKVDRDLRINRPVSPVPQEVTKLLEDFSKIDLNKETTINKELKLLIEQTENKYNNFNTVPCPFSPMRLNFGITKPTNIRTTLSLSAEEQLKKSMILPTEEIRTSTLPECKPPVPIKFPSRPISPYPVYIPISRTVTPIPDKQEVSAVVDTSNIKQIISNQEEIQVKNTAVELKETENITSGINQKENVEPACQKNVIDDSSEIRCSKPPEAVIGARPIFGQTDINNELRKAFGLVKQTQIKDPKTRQTIQTAENKSIAANQETLQINQAVSDQITDVKLDSLITRKSIDNAAEQFEEICKVLDEPKLDNKLDEIIEAEGDYQPQPIKSLIKTFEENTMPVMKYKQIIEPSAEMIINLQAHTNGTSKSQSSTSINKTFETSSESKTEKLFSETKIENVNGNTVSESVSKSIPDKVNNPENNMYYVASATVKTRTFLPTESITVQQSSESFLEKKSELKTSEEFMQSSSSQFSSEKTSSLKVQQSGGQQLLEGKVAVFGFEF